MTQTPKQPAYLTHLQDVHLEQTSLSLPESMREPFIWLGVYLREDCNRSLDVLESNMSALGLPTTGSTIGKMIQGRWQKDADNNPTAAPVIAEKKFVDLVDRLRKQARLSAMAGQIPFIETETWQSIEPYIDVRRAAARICKFGLIIGPTGSQKSECLKQYATRNNHGACVHIEAPDTPTMGKFIHELARSYGVKHQSWADKRVAILDNVNAAKTIIVDNVQRLFKPGHGWNQPILSFLQKLQDDTRCTIILACVPESELVRGGHGYFEQFEGRCGGRQEFLWLPEYPQPSELLQIAEAFKLRDPQKHLPVLEDLAKTRGRIRVLFNTLQLAKQLAETEARKHITIADIRAVQENQKLNDQRARKF
jgi:AAA domain